MVAKKIIIGLSCTAIALYGVFFAVSEKSKVKISELEKPTLSEKKAEPTLKKAEIKKYDLYSDDLYDIPLYSIVEISKLSSVTKKTVDKLLESSLGFYFLKIVDDKVFVILKNPVTQNNTYHRHDLQFAEISSDGSIVYHNAGFIGDEGEIFAEDIITDDIWQFDKKLENSPTKHISYDEKGKIRYSEKWYYDFDNKKSESIKYEMKDSTNKTISVLKESYSDESNYRKEHVFYDNNGNIVMSLSINYDGANITRLTFYNAHDAIDSVSVLTEYTNGLKTKELIYNQDYQLLYTVEAKYTDDKRKEIKLLSNDGAEITKISS